MNDMETQEWWRTKWHETPTVEFVEWVIAEAVRRRDAELLEKVEGMVEVKESPDYSAHQYNAGYRQAVFDTIKLIKDE